MVDAVTAVLLVFYCGAVFATAVAWVSVARGVVRYSALRDLTGIADPAALTRLFGRLGPNRTYVVSFRAVLKHRTWSGLVLGDLPVHALFVAALAWALTHPGTATGAALMAVACLNAFVVMAVALRMFAANPRAVI